MKNLLIRHLFTILVLFSAVAGAHESHKVLASVHPLALVAASVADDLETLVPLSTTPHDFALRPSDVGKIRAADVIVWGGAKSEPYLAKFARRWPEKHWIDVSALGKDRQSDNPHWWFNPELMLQAQAELAAALGKSSQAFRQQLQQQLQSSREQLQPVSQQSFFVFHSAYDHWVNYFGLKQAGAFTLSPEQKPGLRTLNKMRDQLAAGHVQCVFSEPQFSPALVTSVTRDLNVRIGELDPLGVHISVTKRGYADFVSDLTQRFVQCLSNNPRGSKGREMADQD